MSATTPNKMEQRAEKSLATLVYALQAATFAVGITYFIAPLVIYWKQSSVAGTWLESHLRWQLNSFWFSLIGATVGIGLMPLGLISFMIIAATAIWFVFRIVQGWSSLSRGLAMRSQKKS